MEYKVEGLRPATAYAMRLAAVNAIGKSEYSEPLIVKTLEEAPSDPPHNVQMQATAPGELLVKWKVTIKSKLNKYIYLLTNYYRLQKTVGINLAMSFPSLIMISPRCQLRH